MASTHRIEFLDGLRGIAILMVIGFHAFSRWPDFVPYGYSYGGFPVFTYGWMGVELFFLISGFVILMTLEKCTTLSNFLYRRWIRLFPAMLISSLLVFSTIFLFQNRPQGIPEAIYLLPGLTFVEPTWWGGLLGMNILPIEGAFWSLFVEFKFYIFAALVYFSFGRNVLIISLVVVFVLSIAFNFLSGLLDNNSIKFFNWLFTELSFHYFGWFAAGAAYYVYYQSKDARWFTLGLLISLACCWFMREHELVWQTAIVAMCVSSLFALSLVSHRLQKLLNLRLFLFFGFISYPLYLIHENAMISMIVFVGELFPSIPGLLYPIIPVMVLSLVAYCVVKYGEGAAKKLIVRLLRIKTRSSSA